MIEAGRKAHAAGRLQEAVGFYGQVLQSNPNHPEALHLIGLVAFQAGDAHRAVELIRKAAGIGPTAEIHYNLAVIQQSIGDIDQALANYRQSLTLNPSRDDARNNLGVLLSETGRKDEAIAQFRQVIGRAPGHVDAHINLGNAFFDLGQIDQAAASYRQAIALDPQSVVANNNLGNIARAEGRFGDAIAHYRHAIACNPGYAQAHNNLGTALHETGDLAGAEASFRQAIAIAPLFAEAYSNLAGTLQIAGRLKEAVECYRQALAINPRLAQAHSYLIFTLDMLSGVDTLALQDERKRWDGMHASPLVAELGGHANSRNPDRPLRIGYVSADFRDHSAALVFSAPIIGFNRAEFEVYLYSNSKREDAVTGLLRRNATAWRCIAGMPDHDAAEMIRRDGIDILVDLSGHSAENRLLVFARKPAPIQVSAWGYATTTGLSAMDAFFADPVLVPEDEKPMYTEEIRYLPNVVSYFPLKEFPEVELLPAAGRQGIVFGSFNRLAKISDETLAVWAELLRALPESTLHMKTPELDAPAARQRLADRFASLGVAVSRIVFAGKSSWREHMQAYGKIDIALDPFPHGGGVTALEGLMMGVPMITLRCPTIVGRLSASILTAAGLEDWIAESPAQYVDIARSKVGDVEALAALRAELRGRMRASPIGDCTAYVAAVEREYRTLWRRWCAA